ncbi:signal peptidase I [Schaalia sp. ZJ405]|uniref:signal peptidase I n=1 Tax=unclassified Schaalia TaxID=2691889 RepID=UPI0013EC0DD1|nr:MULTISPECIES: signal peptidase I [unclassified Schaalia]QPK81993.1 signal peptidase I [Schaalia sp. ZJ405]
MSGETLAYDAKRAGIDPGPSHLPSIRQMEMEEERRRKSPLNWLKEFLTIVVVALVISTLLRAFIVQVFWIPSPSMRNTLIEKDRIAVSRIDALTKNIRRGDVVVFRDDMGWLGKPEEASTNVGRMFTQFGEFTGFVPAGGEQTLVKRVIGVGGDHVTCCTATGQLAVNGKPVDEPYIADGQAPSNIPFDVVVPKDSLWVMGDNRGNSADSRYHMGQGEYPYIPVSSVVGTVQAVIFPFNRWTTNIGHREVFSDTPDASQR